MRKKILVVDDEPAIGRLVKMNLTMDGYDARTATSGFEALDIVKDWQPALIVLDVMMPGLSGLEVCQKIKQNANLQSIKIIFLSARGSSRDIQQGMSAGGDYYLVKPFDPEELLEKVREMIGPGQVEAKR